MTEQGKRIEEAKARISVEAVDYAQELQFTGGYKLNAKKQLDFINGGLSQLESYERQFGKELNELASLRSELENQSQQIAGYGNEVLRLRSELALKEKENIELISSNSILILEKFEIQNENKQLSAICKAADKVIEQIHGDHYSEKYDELYKIYDQLKNTKP